MRICSVVIYPLEKQNLSEIWRLRRQISLDYITTAPPQISLDYYTIPPATQAKGNSKEGVSYI